VRLAIHIGLRHTTEDFRYVEMRNSWMAEGEITYFIKAFIYIFMMQGLFSLIINSASLYTTIYTADSSLVWSDYVGLAIWVVGFCFEIIGDH
jgi:steroid 5-alpha reductase family enzyme